MLEYEVFFFFLKSLFGIFNNVGKILKVKNIKIVQVSDSNFVCSPCKHNI